MKYNPYEILALASPYSVTPDNSKEIRGWIVSKAEPLTHVTLFLNSVLLASDYPLTENSEIANILPDLPHALQSLFHVKVPKTFKLDITQPTNLKLIAKQNGREVGSVSLQIRELLEEQQTFPLPPAELQTRIGQHNSAEFLKVGWRIFASLSAHIQPYTELKAINRTLDWGCGCGRITRFMIEAFGKERVFGCDIDGVAIDWVKHNLNSWTFTRVNGSPPTPYPDNYFDFIYGTSVFTHLTEPMQFKWLEELRRIVRPGGLVAVSVLNLKDLFYHPHLKGILELNGIADNRLIGSEFLVPFVDEEYYRVTFHTPQYISNHWSEYFELLEYIELAVNVHQDLIIMRKR